MTLNSDDLSTRINKEIQGFKESLKLGECNRISLEFYTKKKRSWPLNFQFENIPWEIWTVKIELMQLSNENGILLKAFYLTNMNIIILLK